MRSTLTSRTRPADVSSKASLDRLRLLRRQLDALLDQELVPGPLNGADGGDKPGSWVPAVDLLETEDAYELMAELPGVLREDLELRVVNARLELVGLRRVPSGSGSFHRMEGRYGPFHRALALGPDADENRIEASLTEGVLTVRVMKKHVEGGKREITVAWNEDDD